MTLAMHNMGFDRQTTQPLLHGLVALLLTAITRVPKIGKAIQNATLQLKRVFVLGKPATTTWRDVGFCRFQIVCRSRGRFHSHAPDGTHC